MAIKYNASIQIELTPSEAHLLKGLVQNAPYDESDKVKKCFESIFYKLPDFQELIKLENEEK